MEANQLDHRAALQLINTLPVWADETLPEQIRAAQNNPLVVIDDDPTGSQTVYDVPLLFTWDIPPLTSVFGMLQSQPKSPQGFYILTNSRGVPQGSARDINLKVAYNLKVAAIQVGSEFTVISRSDSTLRGHFPVETDALNQELGPYDGLLLAPYLGEAGRITVGDVHYLRQGDELIPVAQTPFARDPAFPYVSSNLRHWVEEKTGGRWTYADCVSITLEDIRQGGPSAVQARLMAVSGERPVILNAAHHRDIEVAALGFWLAKRQGKRFLIRSAASFVRGLLGLYKQPVWQPERIPAGLGGLVVVGSYVPQTNAQLQELLAAGEVESVEVPVERLLAASEVLETSQLLAEIDRLTRTVDNHLRNGRTVVLYSSREMVTGFGSLDSFSIGRVVTEALTQIVANLETNPAFLIAKGGITAHEVARSSLGCTRATVIGQILPGVPVWRLENSRRFEGQPYIVFPGNVGSATSLLEVVRQFQTAQREK